MSRIVLAFLLSITSFLSFAADRYWIGAANNNWNDTGNWSTSSGGAGGASVPGASDRALFNSNGNVNCTVDIGVTIQAINISSGYTSTIDLNGNTFLVSGATANSLADGTVNNTLGGTVFTISSTGTTTFSGTTFGADVTVSSNRILLNGSTFNGKSRLTKTGAGSDAGTGGNTFGDSTFIALTGSGYFMTGNTTADSFNGVLTVTNTGTRQIYIAHNSAGNAFNQNVIVNCTSTSGVRFGGGGSATSTLAANRTITIGALGFTAGEFWLRNITQSGNTAQNMTLTGTGYWYSYDSDWGGNITVTSPRLRTRGTRYRGTVQMTKNGASSDGSDGGNTFDGVATFTNTGSGYILLGSSLADTFQSDLILNNSGSHYIYLAYNSLGNTIGGNLTVNNNGSGTSNLVYICQNTNSSLSITGNVVLNNASAATNSYIYLGDNGDVTVGGTFTATNASTGGNGRLYVANGTNSLVTINGIATINNTANNTQSRFYFGNNGDVNLNNNMVIDNSGTSTTGITYVASGGNSAVNITGTVTATNAGTGTEKRVYLGNSGDITVGGNMALTNTSTANTSYIQCNNASTSVGVYNGNIVLVESDPACDGILFGNGGGSGTLAATRTVTIGGGGFSAGLLQFRNFTQTGATAQSLTLTGTGYLYHYDADWGGNVTFVSPRFVTRGTHYQGTAQITKNSATDDQSAGGNVFDGNATLNCTGTGYMLLGNGSPDTFRLNATLTNSGTRGIYLAYNSAGNYIGGDLSASNTGTGANTWFHISSQTASTLTIGGNASISNTASSTSSEAVFGYTGDVTLTGNLTLTSNASGTNGYMYMARNTNSMVSIGGNLTATHSGAGGTKRTYIGSNGDFSIAGTTTLTNTCTATNSQLYVANSSTGSGVFSGNIILSASGANCDGILFGASGGTSTLAATRTVTIGGGGFSTGSLYFRNFTQTGPTAQTLVLTGTGYFTNYDSNWGGNVTFSAPRYYTRNTDYQGTATLTKSGANSDLSYGGNSFAGDVVLTNSGSGYLGMGQYAVDTFALNVNVVNNSTDGIQLGYDSAGHYIGGNLIVANAGTYFILANRASSAYRVDGNVTVTNTGAASYTYIGSNGDVTIGGDLDLTASANGAGSAETYIARNSTSSLVVNGNTTITNAGTNGVNKRLWIGNGGDVTFNGTLNVTNSSTSTNNQVYLNSASTSTGSYNNNIVLENTTAQSDGIYFGSGTGTGTLAATRTISIGAGGFSAGQLYFRNFTQVGPTAQTLVTTGDTRFTQLNSNWGGNVTFTGPRFLTSGTTYSGTATLTKTGASADQSAGGNTFTGNAVLNCTGSGYFMMGNGNSDAFAADLTMNNSGTSGMYLGYNSAGNTIGGNLVQNNTGTGTTTFLYTADRDAATVAVTGNVTITSSSSATTADVVFGNRGDVTVGGDLTIANNPTGANSNVLIASQTTSAVSVSGNTALSQSGGGNNRYIYVGNHGDVTFTGTLSLTNSASANASFIRCNNTANSVGTYNGNIVLVSDHADSDGIYFGSSTGSGTLAATRTVTIGGGGFIAGQLYFRNFTQVGPTPQTLVTTGTSLFNQLNSNWGGNVVFTAPRYYTRGTTYSGTATITKTDAGDDRSVGGNTFTGNAILNCTGSGYLMMGDGNPDAFTANLTMNNSGTRGMYLGYNSAGNTIGGNLTLSNTAGGTSAFLNVVDRPGSSLSVGGNLSLTNTSTATTSDMVIANHGTVTVGGNMTLTNTPTSTNSSLNVASQTTSSISVGGNTTLMLSGAGTNRYIVLGNNGDVALTGTLSITNAASATNSTIRCNHSANSAATYGGNIVVECTNAVGDGVFFGGSGGSATLAATRTVSVGGGGFIAGQLYFRNFTQVGPTAQAITTTGTSIFYNYNSNWGGNVTFTGPRHYTRGTTYSGTAVLTKSGAGDDQNAGGNTFTGNATLNCTGSGYFMMGNGNSDTFSADVTLNNSGTRGMYLAYNSAGNTVGGNLVVNNTASGSSGFVVVSDLTASTLAITGNATINNTSSATTANVTFGSSGDITIGGNLTASNAPTGTNSTLNIAGNTASSVAVTGNTDLTLSGAGNSRYINFGLNGDVSVGGTFDATNSAMASASFIRCNYGSNSVATYGGNMTLENTNAASDGITFGGGGGSATLAATRTVNIGAGGFVAGLLQFRNFTQTGATAQSLTLTGTALLDMYTSNWGGNLTTVSPRLTTRGTTYSGTTNMTKNGAGNDVSYGGNTFVGNSTLTDSGSGYLLLGNGNPDVWNADLTFVNSGTYRMYLAYNSAGNSIAGNLIATNSGSGNNIMYLSTLSSSTLSIGGNATINNSGTGSSVTSYFGEQGDINLTGNLIMTNTASGNVGYNYVANNGNSTVTIGGNVTLTNSGAASTKRTYFGNYGDVSITGTTAIINSSTASNSQFYSNYRSSSNVTFGGNITVENTSASSDGVYFGGNGGTATLTAGNNITVGGGGFVSNDLYMRNFTQLGSAASTLNITGTGRYYPYNATINGNMTVNCERFYSRNSIYNGDFTLNVTGATSSYSYGDNTYNGDVTYNMSSSGTFRTANNLPNDYNGDVTFIQSAGAIQPEYNQPSTFAGNITVDFASSNVTFASGGGTVVLDGTGNQTLNDGGTTSGLRFRRMTLNKAAGTFTLNEPLTITTLATFTSGRVYTDATNLLTFNDNAASSGANDDSFVDGPVEKVGNDIFIYPVGDGTNYQPLAISAPSSASARFRAQYFQVDPSSVYNWGPFEAPLVRTSSREYWILDRIASTNAVNVTLSWDANSGGVTDLASLAVSRWDGSTWRYHGNGGTTGNTTAGTVVTGAVVTSFSPFTLGSTVEGNNPLPVDLVEFKATPNVEEKTVDLFWVTSSELNNDHFTVERTKDLKEYHKVLEVEGQGTTNSRTEYNETDYEPFEGVSYYRLSQTDFDGKTEFFNLEKVILELNESSKELDVQLYPNPNNGHNMYLKIPSTNAEELKVLVNDYIGKDFLVDFTVVDQGDYTLIAIEMNEKLQPGSYMINVTVGDEVHTHKLIVQ